MKNALWFLWILLGVSTLISCKKEHGEGLTTIERLYIRYENGQISECTLNGEKVYTAGIHASDAGGFIYSEDGKELGSCGGWTGGSPLCEMLENCELVYHNGDPKFGGQKIDKYGLSK